MKSKLRLEVTQIEGEWERREMIIEVCKKAIEAWKGDDLTSGYIVRKHYRQEGYALVGGTSQIPFLYLEAIEEKIPTKLCEECDGMGKISEA